MYKTVPLKAKFTDEEKVFWLDQCQHANSLINSAIYETRQRHYAMLQESDNAFSVYWRGDELCYGWKTYKCRTTYPELDKVLQNSPLSCQVQTRKI